MPVELPGGEAVELLLPLFTNARHNSRCPHDHYIEPCPPGTSTAKTTTTSGSGSKSSNLCFYWVAGVDLQKGDEVCVSYGYLRPDQALLMYGLSSTIPSTDTATNSSSSSSDGDESGPEMWLSGLDTMEADGDNPLGFVSGEPLQHWRPGNVTRGGGGLRSAGADDWVVVWRAVLCYTALAASASSQSACGGTSSLRLSADVLLFKPLLLSLFFSYLFYTSVTNSQPGGGTRGVCVAGAAPQKPLRPSSSRKHHRPQTSSMGCRWRLFVATAALAGAADSSNRVGVGSAVSGLEHHGRGAGCCW